MPANINRVVLVGNLTRDPELRHTPSGMAVCNLRLAVNSRKKDESGNWIDKPNYFDVTVWGSQGENCAQYLAKGRPVAIDGRLEWREWETPEGAKRRPSTWSPTTCSSSAAVATARGRRGRRRRRTAAGRWRCPGAAPDFPSSASDDDIPF